MSSETRPTMPGAWPEDVVDPVSNLTFTLDEFVEAAVAAQTFLDASLHMSKEQLWLSEAMSNMTIFTHAEELVDKSVSYVTFVGPFIEDSIASQQIEGVATHHQATNPSLLLGIVRYSREKGLNDRDVLPMEKFRGGVEDYWRMKRIQKLMWLLLQQARGLQRFRSIRERDIVAFVDALPTVEVDTAMQDNSRCPFCWGSFGTAADACTGLVKQVGCCGKWFGRDCLIEAIKANELCPNCRREFEIVRGAGEEGV